MQPNIIKKPGAIIAPNLLDELQQLTQEDGQVVVHCVTSASLFSSLRARIQKTTFLFDLSSDHQSDLLHVVNIALAPEWTIIEKGGQKAYSLIFSGLPKTCSAFDLVELNEPYRGFAALGVHRNETDVYYLQL